MKLRRRGGVFSPMKLFPPILLAVTTALGAAVTASAQTFRPETVSGAIWGGAAGAVIGHNSGDLGRNAWRGAALGAAAGAVIGETIATHRGQGTVHAPPPHRVVTTPTPAPRVVQVGATWSHGPRAYGYGYAPHRRVIYRPHSIYDSWGWYRPVHVWTPGYSVGVSVPVETAPADPRVTGALLGGAAGAIIGHNQGRRGWEGAALGAAAGWILGNQARPTSPPPAPVAPAARATDDTPAGLTGINHFHGPVTVTGGGANALFGR
jgi:uncharacterized protein YcfJ